MTSSSLNQYLIFLKNVPLLLKQEKTTANEQLDWLLSEKVAGKVINLYCGEDLNIFSAMKWLGVGKQQYVMINSGLVLGSSQKSSLNSRNYYERKMEKNPKTFHHSRKHLSCTPWISFSPIPKKDTKELQKTSKNKWHFPYEQLNSPGLFNLSKEEIKAYKIRNSMDMVDSWLDYSLPLSTWALGMIKWDWEGQAWNKQKAVIHCTLLHWIGKLLARRHGGCKKFCGFRGRACKVNF